VSLPLPPVMTWLPELPIRMSLPPPPMSVSVPLVGNQNVIAARSGQRRGNGHIVDDGRGGRVAAHRDPVGRVVGERTAKRRVVGEEGIAAGLNRVAAGACEDAVDAKFVKVIGSVSFAASAQVGISTGAVRPDVR